MPFHVNLSRRSFLAQTTAGVVSLACTSQLRAASAQANPNVLALLSDTHIPNSSAVEARGTNMTRNLQQVVAEVTALNPKPAGVIINGDCAYLKGLPADYANLAECVSPLEKAKLPLHVTMGNHDDRVPLYDAFQSQKPEQPVIDSKHVSVIETPHANWFLLDSLKQVDLVTGELGATQRKWLARELDARTDKPAIVMAHHNPQFTSPAEGQRWTGIQDTAELFDIFAARAHVKAFVFGHSHNWSVSKKDKLNLINLPPVAYVFGKGKPNGWVHAQTNTNGLQLQLHTIDSAHPQSGQRVELNW